MIDDRDGVTDIRSMVPFVLFEGFPVITGLEWGIAVAGDKLENAGEF